MWEQSDINLFEQHQCLIACSMKKMEGEGVNDICIYVGRQRREGSLMERMYFAHALS